MPDFHAVAKLSDLPVGGSRMVRAQGKSIGLYNVGGEILAVEDVCPHRGAALTQGDVEKDVVTCPLHGWRFNVRTGQGCDFPQAKVAVYPVRVDGDQVLVAL